MSAAEMRDNDDQRGNTLVARASNVKSNLESSRQNLTFHLISCRDER